MNEKLKEMMKTFSVDELREYITQADKFTIEAITLAINELKTRGIILSDDETISIEKKFKKKKKEKEVEDKMYINDETENIVDDTNIDAPVFYTQKAIWIFSTVFTVIFGAILLMSNLKDKKSKWIVFSFGVLYTAIAILILSQFPRNTSMTFMVNALGSIILTQLFWNKYIGTDIKYRKKKIWKPLIISIMIMIPFIFAAIYNGGQ